MESFYAIVFFSDHLFRLRKLNDMHAEPTLSATEYLTLLWGDDNEIKYVAFVDEEGERVQCATQQN